MKRPCSLAHPKLREVDVSHVRKEGTLSNRIAASVMQSSVVCNGDTRYAHPLLKRIKTCQPLGPLSWRQAWQQHLPT